MNTTQLGRTGLTVSRLCFGTGTTTFDCESAQSKLEVPAFGAALLHAYRQGVTFWDTSDNYNTHAHVAWAIGQIGDREKVVLTSKTYAKTASEARESLENTLRELGTDYVDVLLLHEMDSPEELDEHQDALDELHRAKAEGLVRAVGLSTHAILTLEAVAGRPDIDVILTNFNFANVHMDANIKDYRAAMTAAHAAGQGVIAMKTLGEGKLANRRAEAIPYNLAQPFIHSVVVGMMDTREVDECVAIADAYLRDPAGHTLVMSHE
jgi:aryl-alcohol dehydrogenase-like predicted oxidoreductase